MKFDWTLLALGLLVGCGAATTGERDSELARPLTARAQFRAAIAAGGAAAEDAIRRGLADPDAAIRRFALWSLYERSPAKAYAALTTLTNDASVEVSTLVAEIGRGIPDKASRTDFLLSFARSAQTAEAKKIASSYIEFPFYRQNIAKSVNPVYDHDLAKVWTFDFPTDGWRFYADRAAMAHLGKGSCYLAGFQPGRDWVSVGIGRHWENYPGVGEYDGIGWYLIDFTLPERKAGESYELCFDGVDEEAWVWLNGKYLGQHAEGVNGWNKPFRFDVERELRWGATNRLLVRVSDTFAGGGIWKGIRLEVLK